MKCKKSFLGGVILALILSLFTLNVNAQSLNVKGAVRDNNGDPMIGVSVKVQGSGDGTITDVDGNYSIKVPTNGKLQFSFLGYVTQTISVNGKPVLNVVLKEDATNLDEIVVIGYQTVRRKDLTGSVASVNGKEIAAVPVSDISQALQGKLPGVNITSQDGRPEASISIRVRGGGSISQSNEPLILVDGATVTSLNDIPADQVESIDVLKDASSTAIYGARGANGVILVTTKGAKEGRISLTYNGYAKFNRPIDYMDVLSPYDYLVNTWANVAAMADDANYRNPFEKLYGIGAYQGSGAGIEGYRNVAGYNMQKEVYSSSFSHNHDITLNGGTDKTKVLLALNYTDDEGMKLNSYNKRIGASLKFSQKLRDNLDIALDARYTDRRIMGSDDWTSGRGSILSSAYRFRPITSADIEAHGGNLDALKEGNYGAYSKESQWDLYNNARRIADEENLTLRQVLRSTLSLNWGIMKGLTYHTDLTLMKRWEQDKVWKGAIANAGDYVDEDTGEKLYAGSVDYRKQDSWNMRWTNTLNYNLDITKNQHLNILAGHEVTNSGGTDLRIKADHFPSNFTKDNAFAMINQYDASKGVSSFSSGKSTPSRILSFFGRANYSILDRYLLTATFRADGSSKFTKNNRWGYFPAAAVAWRVSEEPFMAGTKSWLDNLKVRLSYGEVGNDAIDSDLLTQSWTAETNLKYQYALDNKYQTAYKLANAEMANPNLKWETTITRDLGFDFAVLNSRLSGTIDLYWNTTKDLLMRTTIPGVTGFASTYANIGQTSNKGVEISLSGVILNTKDWNLQASMNINFNRGKVDKLAPSVDGLYGTSWNSSQTFPGKDYILMEGKPVGQVRGFVYDGFYTVDDFDYVNGTYVLKEGISDLGSFINTVHEGVSRQRPKGQNAYPGLPKFIDRDNSGTIDEADATIIGDMTPKHTGGFNITGSYKNIDFGAYFNWSYGNDIYNVNKLASLNNAKEWGAYENKLSIVKNCFRIYDVRDGELVALTTPEQLKEANVNATLPLPYSQNGITSTLGIEDGSYLRLNTLTVGYTFPKKWMQKAGINNLRLYGSIYNVFTITSYSGLDPEVNSNTAANKAFYPTVGLDWGTSPRARSFVIGLNLNL